MHTYKTALLASVGFLYNVPLKVTRLIWPLCTDPDAKMFGMAIKYLSLNVRC